MENVNPNDSRQGGLIAVSAVMLVIAVVAVSLRCWSIYIQPARKFGLDDFFAIMTLPFIIGQMALIFHWLTLGLGRHFTTIPPSDIPQIYKIIFATSFMYGFAVSLPKFSVLFFYDRIFQRTSQWLYIATIVVGTLNLAWLVASWFTTIFACVPVEASWTMSKDARCMEPLQSYLGTSIPSMVIDLCILLIPLPRLWNLKASKTRRAFVTCIFICGYSVIIISMGRLITLARGGEEINKDFTWSAVSYIGWVQCEGAISVMSVSLPNIFQLVRRVQKHGLASAFQRKHYGPPKLSFFSDPKRQKQPEQMEIHIEEGQFNSDIGGNFGRVSNGRSDDALVEEEEMSPLEFPRTTLAR